MEGVAVYVRRANGEAHAFRRLPVVPRAGEEVVTTDGRRWSVQSVSYVLGVDGCERVDLMCVEVTD